MSQDVQRLLHNLREAIHETLAESLEIRAAMAELESAGQCPSFSVDISLPEEKELPSVEMVTRDGALLLTARDGQFLRNIGVETSA